MIKLPRARRIGRAALLVGIAGLTVGGMLLNAGVANAATVGNNPGAVQLNPASGPISSKPTWATSAGCKTGFQGSAIFREVHPDGTTNSISPAVNGTANPFSGTLQATIAQIQTAGGIPAGGTQELVVICFSGQALSGTSDPEMDIAIHYSADGTSYSTDTNFGGGGSGPQSTTTTLAASPNPVDVGATVTLTATESSAAGTHPPGSVQFSVGGSAIGSANVDSSGTATTTTTFPTAGSESLSATFTPADTTSFAPSTGTFTETVNSQGGGGGTSGTEPLMVTVPQSGGGSGSFILTVPSSTVTLSVSGTNATGNLNQVTVADTRSPAPGWSVTGQTSDFTGAGTIPASQLAWAPSLPSPCAGVTAGGSASLGTSVALASAAAGGGTGTCMLGAGLTLTIPASATPGSYSSTLTLTAATAAP